MKKPPYAEWGDHELLVETVTRLGGIDRHLTRLNGAVFSNTEHINEHCNQITAIDTKMSERTSYGWPTRRRDLVGGGTLLVIVGTIAGSAIAKAIEIWPY